MHVTPRGTRSTQPSPRAVTFFMQDLFNIDGALHEEERAVRDSVRAFVDEQVLPIIGECYVEGRFPKELIPEMAELGVLGANLPEEYGCAGLNNVSYGLIMQELERGDTGVRSFASVQGALVMYPIYAFGSDAQKKKWLPKMARGEVIGCFGLTEPDYGSNPSGMITVANEQGDGSWILNGAKMWITNGNQANVAVVWAKTDGDNDQQSIRGFIVPTDTKGFSAKDQKGKLSLRASDTSELVLQDVHLPADAILPKSGGLKSPLMCLTQARYGIAGAPRRRDGVLRRGRALREDARDVRQADRQIPDPAGAARRHAHRNHEGPAAVAASRPHEGRRHVNAAAGVVAKRNNVNIATDIAREARRLLGANGILAEYAVDAAHGESRIGLYVRGDARRALARSRPSDHWLERVRMKRPANRLPGTGME